MFGWPARVDRAHPCGACPRSTLGQSHKTVDGDMGLEDQLVDIARVPMLTGEEEIILGTQVQNMMIKLRENGIESQITQQTFAEVEEKLDAKDKRIVKIGLRARERIISANMRLVVTVAKKMKTSQTHMTIQDLIQEGAVGLARAAEKFEPSLGYKFSTYAYWWIRQGIARASEYQEKMIRVPVGIQKMAKNIRDSRDSLLLELGREPTIGEIAKKLDCDAAKIKKIILFDINVTSLDVDRNQDGERIELLEIIPADGDEAPEINQGKLDLVMLIVGALPESERLLILQRYGIGVEAVSAKEIAEREGTNEQAIRRRQQKISQKIKKVASSFSFES